LSILLFVFFVLGIKGLNNDYQISKVTDNLENGFPGIFASANYKGKDEYYLKPKSTIAKTLNITVSYESDTEFTVKITRGEKAPRFQMAHEFPYSYTKTSPEDFADPEYTVHLQKKPFSFSVDRKATEETIFDTSKFDFIYSEFFLTFGTTLPSEYLYGLGERRTRHFLYRTGVYTIWCKDQFAQIDDGVGNQETYGAHPVYLIREKSGNWHMMYLRTTNALDFAFNSTDKSLKYMITGGELELKFFLGDKYPDTVIKMYHDYINKWTLMPFWSFGYHQSRWGYIYLQDMIDVVNNMTHHKLPMDVIWSDIDYMDNFTDFTVDYDRYDLAEFRNLLEKVRWVPIIDAGVFINYTTPAYIVGTEYDVWIKSAQNHSNYLVGVVWPGMVHWPDWLHPNASKYWGEMLSLLYSYVPFSGIWIDMDENSNFCFGEYPNECFFLPNYLPDSGTNFNLTSDMIIPTYQNVTLPAEKHPNNDTFEFLDFNSTGLPYIPGQKPLEDHGLSLNALHYGDVLSFDFHNLDPFYEAYYTYQGQLNLTGERPFILTRGNFVGTGQFSAHWTGDNVANWDFYRVSVPHLFALQMFGIPMVGADICGFADDTKEELCARWMQLGAFYPFMRNHNQLGTIAQEPYALGPTVMETSRAALRFRYSILKFYYSIFVRNNGTGTIFRPLFFDFPDDEKLLDLQTQFLIGSELMVSVPQNEGDQEVSTYLPAGVRWYEFPSGKRMLDLRDDPVNITVKAPLNDTLPIFVKGGSIIHMQNVDNVQTTKDLDSTFNLVVALTPTSADNSLSFGQMMGIVNYTDDASVDRCLDQNDCLINIAANAIINEHGLVSVDVTFSPNTPKSQLEKIYLGNITFYGVRTEICNLDDPYCTWDDYTVECVTDKPKVVEFNTISYSLSKEGCSLLS